MHLLLPSPNISTIADTALYSHGCPRPTRVTPPAQPPQALRPTRLYQRMRRLARVLGLAFTENYQQCRSTSFRSARLSRLSLRRRCAALACSGAAAASGDAAGYPGLDLQRLRHHRRRPTPASGRRFHVQHPEVLGRRTHASAGARTSTAALAPSSTSRSTAAGRPSCRPISEQRRDGTYKPVIEWANIKYQVTPDLSLRFGRIALPIFLAADYRKVGYAYPWVRTPVEVYNALPLSNSDGVDATYRWNRAPLKNVTQASSAAPTCRCGTTPRSRRTASPACRTPPAWGDASARVSVVTAEPDRSTWRAQLFDGYRQFGAQGVALAERFDVDHRRVRRDERGPELRSGPLVRHRRAGTGQVVAPSSATPTPATPARATASATSPPTCPTPRSTRTAPTSRPGPRAGRPAAGARRRRRRPEQPARTSCCRPSRCSPRLSAGAALGRPPRRRAQAPVRPRPPAGGSRGTLINVASRLRIRPHGACRQRRRSTSSSEGRRMRLSTICVPCLQPPSLAVMRRLRWPAELVVIVSASSPVAALRPDQVADIFLGQAGRFPGRRARRSRSTRASVRRCATSSTPGWPPSRRHC